MEQFGGRASHFEDLLASDDLYLSFLNSYLALPVFSCKLRYNRFLGLFERLLDKNVFEEHYFGATEDEKEKMLLWAAQERLYQFGRSDLFRELKLCRLLLKPIETTFDDSSFNESSQILFGSKTSSANHERFGRSRNSSENENWKTSEEGESSYSEEEPDYYTDGNTITAETTDYSGETRTTVRNSADTALRCTRKDHEYSKYFKIRRQSMICENAICPRLDLNMMADRPSPLIEQSVCDESSRNNNSNASLSLRRQSEPVRRIQPDHKLEDMTLSEWKMNPGHLRKPDNEQSTGDVTAATTTVYEADLAETLNRLESVFADNSSHSLFTRDGTDVETFQQRLQSFHERQSIPLQRLKELLLSSREGLHDFIAFLAPTNGIHLVDFWLDCEAVRMHVDTQPTYRKIKAKFELLRDLEDRYALHLRPKSRRHLMTAMQTLSLYLLPSQSGNSRVLAERLGEAMFDRIQYDTLCQIRAYWLPCWLLHWETKVAQCQFLPTSLGGSALFYVASHRSALTESRWTPDTESQSGSLCTDNYSRWSPERDENLFEGSATYGTASDDQEDDEVPVEEEQKEGDLEGAVCFGERRWIEEIRDRALSRALQTGRLIEIERNHMLVKSAEAKRLKQPPPSTLESNYSGVTRYSNIIQIPHGTSQSTRSATFTRDVRDGNWLNSIPISWSIPCKPDIVLGLTRLPGSTWESLKKQSSPETTVPRLRVSRIYQPTSLDNSSVCIVPLTEALGLELQSTILAVPDEKNADSDVVQAMEKSYPNQSFVPFSKSQPSSRDGLSSRMHTALIADAASGGPFQVYLESRGLEQESRALGFLQALHEFSRQTQCPVANRFTRLSKAWHIVNTFVVSNGRYDLDLNPEMGRILVDKLRTKRNLITSRDFEPVGEFCLDLLKPYWIDYLKYDIFMITRALSRHTDETPPPESPDDFEVLIVDNRVTIKRVYPVQPIEISTTEQRMSKEEHEQRIIMALERRRAMERERKRALKAVQQRQKEINEKLPKAPIGLIRIGRQTDTGTPTKAIESEIVHVPDRRPSLQAARLKAFLTNKLMMNQFREWLKTKCEQEKAHSRSDMWPGRIRDLDFVTAATRWMAIPTGRAKRELLQRRVKAAENLYKTYLAADSDQTLKLPAKFIKRLEIENQRPSTATYRNLRDHYVHELDPYYEQFLKDLASRLGLQVEQLLSLSTADLEPLLTSPQDSKPGQKYPKFVSRLQPTAEDKEHFEKMIAWCAFRPLTLEVVLFYQYLVDCGQRLQCPSVDQDLIFYLEIARFQELSREANKNKWLVKRKLSCILTTFFESVFPPQVQVDITPDICSRLVKKIQRQLGQRTPFDRRIFDEASQCVLRELLPFYAGFRNSILGESVPQINILSKGVDAQIQPKEIPWLASPLTHKHHDMLQRRLEAYQRWKTGRTSVSLPALPRKAQANAITFSIRGGANWVYAES